ncbi:hypothetical protein ACIQU5_31460 [Streptomyces sp. NPDC090306]|uniref:hypothetical protein n=1 Tax=Streptomyces sp. NPDC090306 TaxID=3365961 RepID=UPI0037F29A08
MRKTLHTTLLLATALTAVSCGAENSTPKTHQQETSAASQSRKLPENSSCRNGEFHWGKIEKRQRLAAVSDAQKTHIAAGKTGSSTFILKPVRTIQASVSPSSTKSAVNSKSALTSLEERTGLDLAAPGTTFALSKGDKKMTTSSGKFDGVLVAVEGIDTAEAPFVYECGTSGEKTVRGTLTTWSLATYSGLFKCGIAEDLEPSEIEAEALLCGESSDQ